MATLTARIHRDAASLRQMVTAYGHDVKQNSCVQACWDADRLDLWRVNIKPDTQYLCTSYAMRDVVIEDAYALLYASAKVFDDRALRET